MSWVKLDDVMPNHPKVMAAGPQGFALDVAALCYASRHATDGFIASSSLPAVLPGLANPQRWAQRLVDAGRWSETEGGWLIHDFGEYQFSRAEIEEREKAKTEKAVRANHIRWHTQRGVSDPECDLCPTPIPGRSPDDPTSISPDDPQKSPVPTRPKDIDPEDGYTSSRGSPLAPKTARDEVWDTLEDIFGAPTTQSNRTLRGKLVKSLGAAGATEETIRARVMAWPFHFPDATLTETALEKHWDRLGQAPARANGAMVRQFEDETRRAQREQRAFELDQRALPG